MIRNKKFRPTPNVDGKRWNSRVLKFSMLMLFLALLLLYGLLVGNHLFPAWYSDHHSPFRFVSQWFERIEMVHTIGA